MKTFRFASLALCCLLTLSFGARDAAAQAPEPCQPGYYSATGVEPCIPCGAGTYTADFGSIACEDCPAGRYASNEGSAECLNCLPGYFAANTGSQFCEPCEAGKAQPLEGAISCFACDEGTYQPNTGSAVCLSCGCDDGNPNTLDGCDPITGECFLPTHISPATWGSLKRLLIGI